MFLAMPWSFRAVFLVIVLLGCGLRHSRSSIANVPGEDSDLAILLGQGINHIDWTPKGFCVGLQGARTQSGQQTGQFAEYRLLEITSEASLRENLNISAAASFRSTLFGSSHGRIDYAKSVNKNTSSRFLLVHARVANQMQLASDFAFTEEAQRLLRENDKARFLQHCGTQFVYGIRTGGEFYALFEYEFTSAKEDEKFSAAIAASGVAWKAGADVNRELAKFDMSARVHAQIYRMGGNGPLPQVEDIKEFGLKFNDMVTAMSGNAVTLELITKDYSGVRPLDIAPNPGLVMRQEIVINQLAANRDGAKETLNTLLYIKRNPDWFAVDGKDKLDDWEQQLSTYINVVNDAAVNCFADIFSGCSLPSATLPSFALPKRIYDPKLSCASASAWDPNVGKCCHDSVTVSCKIRGDDNRCLEFERQSKHECQP